MLQGGIPLAPAVVGLIFGMIAEEQLRRDPSILLPSPITVVLWTVVAITLAAAIAPFVRRRATTSTAAIGGARK